MDALGNATHGMTGNTTDGVSRGEPTLDGRNSVVAQIEQIVTEIIGEDAAEFLNFTDKSRFILDLEMDSIQLIHLIECVNNVYGAQVNFVEWLSVKSVEEILALTVGDVADFVEEGT
jgi:acyl carrier protein